MLKVGITGGIGSGKSFICKIFNDLYKIPIYNSDDNAKKLSNTNPTIISTMKEWYGDDIYIDGKVNRPKLANIIFNDKEELQRVNGLFHPFLEQDFIDWTEQHKKSPYVIFECAVLFENGLDDNVDIVINVDCMLPTKIRRVIRRDCITKEKVLVRMRNQLSGPERSKLSDFTIMNEDYDDTYEQIRNINKKFLTLYEITNII